MTEIVGRARQPDTGLARSAPCEPQRCGRSPACEPLDAPNEALRRRLDCGLQAQLFANSRSVAEGLRGRTRLGAFINSAGIARSEPTQGPHQGPRSFSNRFSTAAVMRAQRAPAKGNAPFKLDAS